MYDDTVEYERTCQNCKIAAIVQIKTLQPAPIMPNHCEGSRKMRLNGRVMTDWDKIQL
jgi:hypothetical protein